MDWLPSLSSLTSLLIPIAYLTILIGSLATFSHIHRQRKISAKIHLQPYFPPHKARNVYNTLLHQTDSQSDLKSVPNSILCAALQERACEDILRIREIQTRKAPLNTLLQRGVVGDEVWQRLLRAEQELEAELKDVVAEANALANGWGQIIFQSANEIVMNRMSKKKIAEVRANLDQEKAKWEQTKEASRLELEGVGEPGEAVQNTSVPATSTGTSTSTSTTTSTPEKPKPSQAPKAAAVADASDEDGVIVETPRADTPTSQSTSGGGGGGGKKKKKGKK